MRRRNVSAQDRPNVGIPAEAGRNDDNKPRRFTDLWSRVCRRFHGCRWRVPRIPRWLRASLLILSIPSCLGLTVLAQYFDLVSGDAHQSLEAIEVAVHGQILAFQLWGEAARLLCTPLVNLLCKFLWIVWPYVRQVGNNLVTVVRNSDPATLFAIGCALGVALILWILKRWITQQRYGDRFVAWVGRIRARYNQSVLAVRRSFSSATAQIRAKSRTAAALIPHGLFVTVSSACLYALPDTIVYLSQGWGFTCLSLVLPCLSTCFTLGTRPESSDKVAPDHIEALGQAEPEPASSPHWASFLGYGKKVDNSVLVVAESPAEAQRRVRLAEQRAVFASQGRENIMLWVLLGLANVAHAFGGSYLFDVIPMLPQIKLFILLWLQLPGTDGTGVLYGLIIPLVNKHIAAVQLPDSPIDQDKGNALLTLIGTVLVTFKMIPSVNFARSFISESGFVLLGLGFLPCPGFIVRLGSVLVGLVFPMYASIGALPCKEQVSDKSIALARRWLQYWLVFTLFRAVHSTATMVVGGLIPFWYHAELLLIMWLQLPLFQGASKIHARMLLELAKFLSRPVREDNLLAKGEMVDHVPGDDSPPRIDALLDKRENESDDEERSLSEE